MGERGSEAALLDLRCLLPWEDEASVGQTMASFAVQKPRRAQEGVELFWGVQLVLNVGEMLKYHAKDGRMA